MKQQAKVGPGRYLHKLALSKTAAWHGRTQNPIGWKKLGLHTAGQRGMEVCDPHGLGEML